MKRLVIAVLTLFLLTAASAWAVPLREGGNSSGGGDRRPDDHDSAWFLGNRPIHFCFEYSEDFGIPQRAAEDEVVEAMQQWKSYLTDRRFGFSDRPELRLSLEFLYDAKCDEKSDLRIYLGVRNPAVEAARAGLVNPAFLYSRESYDVVAGWGRGFIWFTTQSDLGGMYEYTSWKTRGTLMKAALHELGHVFGCGHVAGTIMREDIGLHPGSAMPRIDDDRYLLYPSFVSDRLTLTGGPDSREWNRGATRLFGRAPEGWNRQTIELRGEALAGTEGGALALFTLEDVRERRAFRFEVAPFASDETPAISYAFDHDVPVLRRVRRFETDSAPYATVRDSGTFRSVYYGTLVGAGLRIPALLEINLNGVGYSTPANGHHRLSLSLLEDSRKTLVY